MIFPVIILQLEVFSKDAQPSYQEYFECKQTIIILPYDANRSPQVLRLQYE